MEFLWTMPSRRPDTLTTTVGYWPLLCTSLIIKTIQNIIYKKRNPIFNELHAPKDFHRKCKSSVSQYSENTLKSTPLTESTCALWTQGLIQCGTTPLTSPSTALSWLWSALWWRTMTRHPRMTLWGSTLCPSFASSKVSYHHKLHWYSDW